MEYRALSNEGLARLLLERLEHISVDSVLAHKASGVRGALIRCLGNNDSTKSNRLQYLLEQGFSILEAAAKERSK
ncbi:MAG: hypothetical protein JW963_13465 [Anaerolineales bacterium]|nr:hypothetical protein [Anaerolineales bacterium]